MPPKTDEADDVLDFINSLPESNAAGSQVSTSGNNTGKNEDFLEFLDELAAHDTTKKPATSVSSFEPKKTTQEGANMVSKKEETTNNVNEKQNAEIDAKEKDEETKADREIDPIGQLSSWWSSEGSSKVTSLWGSITTNAQQLSDTTYKLASDTTNQISQRRHQLLAENGESLPQLDQLGDKLNSVLSLMSQQIKEGLIGPDDELLNILLVHDLYNVSNLDSDCCDKFNEVVRQVEGGIRVSVNNFNHKEREPGKINLNLFYGKVIDGEKLCFANLESSIKDYSNIDSAKKPEIDSSKETNASTPTTDSHAINKSNIFISIQAITNRSNNEETEIKEVNAPMSIDSNNKDSFSFTLILKDITNGITIVTKTQPFPLNWALWLNGEGDVDDENVNPAQWVNGWIRDGLSLSFGVLAQQYVIKRMGY